MRPIVSGQSGGHPSTSGAGENILLIRFKSIGDVLFTLPAVHLVRQSFPGAKITFLTSRENAGLIKGFREVNDVIAIDRSLFRWKKPVAALREIITLFRRLRRGRFSLAVDFQGYGETALLTWLTRAPQRWGSVYGSGRRWAYTKGVNRTLQMHPADWNLLLLQQCGLPAQPIVNEFVLPAATAEEAKQLFTRLGLETGKPTLFIQPLTSAPRKNWPLENYLRVATHFRNRGAQVLFGGGPADQLSLEPARQANFPVSTDAPLLVTGGLMNQCDLILGGDTGVMHMAVALGKKVVMLQTSNARLRVFPFQHEDWKIQANPDSPISKIATDAVIAACERSLS